MRSPEEKAKAAYESTKRWRATHREQFRAQQNKWRKENPEKIAASKKKYVKNHSEHVYEVQSAYHAKRRAEWLKFTSTYKLERGCIDCGFKGHAAALDFDHVRGEKLFNISESASRPLEQVMLEVEKCDIRCANCHRIVTYNRSLK
jgi:hypothetical protein